MKRVVTEFFVNGGKNLIFFKKLGDPMNQLEIAKCLMKWIQLKLVSQSDLKKK